MTTETRPATRTDTSLLGRPATATHWLRAVYAYGPAPRALLFTRVYWPLNAPHSGR